jgi:hypothetical protein
MMKKLTGTGVKWLKSIHLIFASLWFGSAITLMFMTMFLKASNGIEQYGIDRSLRFVDDFFVIPGAMGCLLTGLIYSMFTKWGWFKHNFITVKWIITVAGILFGTFFLGPWLNELGPISKEFGDAAWSNQTYLYNRSQLAIYGPIQTFSILFAVVISTLKPWKKKS